MRVNNWDIFAHSGLLDKLEILKRTVEKEMLKNPSDYQSGSNFKLFAALYELLFVAIPSDPTRLEYRQGKTLGEDYKHWFRAKFGGQRFRLFFRYDSSAKVLIYAWVNNSDTLRTYGSKKDAYVEFRRMLDKGDPPDDWDELLKSAKSPGAVARLELAKSESP